MVSELYALFYWELLRYMKKSAYSMAEAEDIVQETFLRALEHEELLDSMSQVQCRAWLYKTAKNVCIDRIRRVRAEPLLTRRDGITDDLTEAEVAQLCSVLTDQERQLFLLHYFEGYPATELAAQFQMPASTIRTRLFTARSKLRKLYPELERRYSP